MSRRPPRFQQADVARALRAAQQVGGDWAVEIEPDGTIRIVPVDPVAKQKRRQNSIDPWEDRHSGRFSTKSAAPKELDARISQPIASTLSQSQAELEYAEAERKYEEFRQRLITERRAQRHHGVRQPPLMDVPELASAAAALKQQFKALFSRK